MSFFFCTPASTALHKEASSIKSAGTAQLCLSASLRYALTDSARL